MKLRFLSVFAIVAALSACESTMDSKGTGSGDGKTTGMSVAPGSEQEFVGRVGDRVFFDLDRYTLRSDAKATLDNQAAWLKRYTEYSITVEGHADERGTREYNLALGERRASAVKRYLTQLGLASNRIKTITYGKERPVALGANEEAWTQNRRGVTVLGR